MNDSSRYISVNLTLAVQIKKFGDAIVMTLLRYFGNLKIKSEIINHYFDKEVGVSHYVPIKYFIKPHLYITQQLDLGVTFKVSGLPFDVKGDDEINHLQMRLSFALQQLDQTIAVYFTTHRHRTNIELEGTYKTSFIKNLYKNYHRQFQTKNMYVNDLYVTFIQKAPKLVTKGNNLLRFLKNIKKKNVIGNFDLLLEKRIKEFEFTINTVSETLTPYSPTLLSKRENEQGVIVSEPLQLLSILVNGYNREFTYPYQDIASFVPEKRLFFGKDTIHFKGQTNDDNLYGAILSIKHYCPNTPVGMLNNLLKQPIEYINTHSYVSIDKDEALTYIEKQFNRLSSVDDAAQSQLDELQIAKDDLASGKINYGYHHNTVLVLTRNKNELDDKVSKLLQVYQDSRLVVVRETLNLESAFWAQIPGNFKFIRRQAAISNHNLTSFQPLHNYYTGYTNLNHLGGALMLLETPSKTPFYFNLHEKGSGRKDDMTRGHTVLIGPSNGGKTVMMSMIDAMFEKYQIRSYFFDRDKGLKNYILACGGQYYTLEPGKSTGFNVCQLPDNEINKAFLRNFITTLCRAPYVQLKPSDHQQIAEVVERNYSLPVEKRRLSTIANFFRLDFSGLTALMPYLSTPDEMGKVGEKAYLFDNATDLLNLNADKVGFDLTHWLPESGDAPAELAPLSMYIFHRMELTFGERLTGIYLDEGWQYLKEDYWREKIAGDVFTKRKKNAFLFLATQQPDLLAKSPIAESIIQGTATKLFLANRNGDPKSYMESFKLTAREYEVVKNLNESDRYFLIKQGQEAAVGRINFTGMEQYLSILSTNTYSKKRVEEAIKKAGHNPDDWLPIFFKEETE